MNEYLHSFRARGGWLNLAAILFLLACAVALHPNLFIDGLPIDERATQNLPERFFNAMCLRQGVIPLWNPFSFFGTAYIASHYTCFFYPPNMILFQIVPPVLGMKLLLFLHTLAAGVFTFLYLRRLRAGRLGASTAGVLFMSSGYLISHQSHTMNHQTSCWMPLLFFFIEGFLQKRDGRNFVGGVLTYSLIILAGYMHAAVIMGYAAMVYCGVYWVAGRNRRRFLGACIVGAMLIWAGWLTAVQNLTTYCVLGETLRAEIAYEFFSEFHLPLSHLPLLAFPLLFGAGPTPFSGTPFEVPMYAGAYNLAELNGWIGVAPPILALIGFWISRRSRRRHVSWAWLTIGVLSFILCLGPETPLNRLMFEAPAYKMFKGPAKNWISVHLAVSVLAGIGIHRLVLLSVKKRLLFRRIVSFAAIAASLAGLGMLGFVFWAIRYGPQPWPDTSIENLGAFISFRGPAVWMPLAAVFFNAALLAGWAITRKIAYPVLIVLTIVPHAAFIKQIMHIVCVDMSAVYSEPEKNDVYAFLKDREPSLDAFRVYPVRLSISDGSYETLYPSINTVYGVRSLAGYGPLFPKALAEMTGIHSTGILTNLDWHLSNSRIISMLNVKYLTVLRLNSGYDWIVSALDGTPDAPSPYRLVYKARNTTRVYENPNALPRAYGISRLLPIGQGLDREQDRLDAIRYIVDEDAPIELGHEAVFEGVPPEHFPAEFAPATVSAVTDGPNKVRASVDSEGPSFVVFCETFYPGWQAFVDGERSEIYRVNGLCIGVFAPEGTKEILLRYRPRAFLAGAAISVVMLLALIPVYFIPRRRRTAGS